MPPTLNELRAQIRPLLDTSSAADAPTVYYALYHDPTRSHLAVRRDAQQAVTGFVGRFQTGLDLFRPVITLRCRQAEVAADLLTETLIVGRPYILFSNLNQLPLVGGSLQISNERILSIYVLDASRFKSTINVLVSNKKAPDGTPRAEISAGGQKAVAGVNWQSPGFAEVYVQTDPEVRQRGWGTSVVAAVTDQVLRSGRIPLYLVEPNNESSVKLATSLGFADTGSRQVLADTVYLGHPAKRTTS